MTCVKRADNVSIQRELGIR